MRFITFTILIICILSINSKSYADWELYDDFESGVINTDKWHIDESSADIEIENGRVKFTHKAGFPNDSSWLSIIQDKYGIEGIKATVNVDSCTGDVRGRVGGDFAMSTDIWAFAAINIRAERQRIDSGISVLDFSDIFLYDAFYTTFNNPIELNSIPYIIGLRFYNNKFNFFTEELGEINATMPGKWVLIDDTVPGVSKGIGSRSSNGDGPCIIYFDDVYVLRP